MLVDITRSLSAPWRSSPGRLQPGLPVSAKEAYPEELRKGDPPGRKNGEEYRRRHKERGAEGEGRLQGDFPLCEEPQPGGPADSGYRCLRGATVRRDVLLLHDGRLWRQRRVPVLLSFGGRGYAGGGGSLCGYGGRTSK